MSWVYKRLKGRRTMAGGWGVADGGRERNLCTGRIFSDGDPIKLSLSRTRFNRGAEWLTVYCSVLVFPG